MASTRWVRGGLALVLVASLMGCRSGGGGGGGSNWFSRDSKVPAAPGIPDSRATAGTGGDPFLPPIRTNDEGDYHSKVPTSPVGYDRSAGGSSHYQQSHYPQQVYYPQQNPGVRFLPQAPTPR